MYFDWKIKVYNKGITKRLTRPNSVFTRCGKTKSNRKAADRLLQCILLNRLFATLAESRLVLFLRFYSSLLESDYSILPADNLLRSQWFWSRFSVEYKHM